MSTLRAKIPGDPNAHANADAIADFPDLDSAIDSDSEISSLDPEPETDLDPGQAPDPNPASESQPQPESESAPVSPPRSHRICLNERYELIKRLGGGAEGTVWKARDLGPSPRDVAVKLINVRDPRRVERLRMEASRLGRLRSSALLPLLDYGENDDVCFYVMPLVDGWTLSQAIRQRWDGLRRQADADSANVNGLDGARALESGPDLAFPKENDKELEPSRRPIASLPWRAYHLAVAGLMARVARALDEAHRHGIAHCDVKPNNVLLDRDRPDEVYLADFGLAREPDSPKDEGSDGRSHRQGTLVYMAPEKLRSAPGRDEFLGDVYSLGATLYEAATCFKPRSIPDSMPIEERLKLLSEQPPLRPRRIRKEIPRDLERIILKAMSPHPQDRYQSPQDLAEDLERFREGAPPQAARFQRARSMWREATRRYLPLLALVFAAIVAGSASWWEQKRTLDHSSRFALDKARRLASERRFEDAARELEAAWSIKAGGGASADAKAAARAVAGPLLDELSRAEQRSDFRDAQRLHEAWRRLAALDSDVEADARFRPNAPFHPVWIGSEPPGAIIFVHHVREDGRPKPGPPFLRLQAGSTSQPAEISGLISGPYWVTAFSPNGDAFAERPWELPPTPRDRAAASGEPANPKRSLFLYPKRTADLARTMAFVRSGTLEMGSKGPSAVWKTVPPHQVEVSEFLLDDREVSYRDFYAFLDQTGRSRTLAPWFPNRHSAAGSRQPENWLDWPVTNIPHGLAIEYAAWRGCRLPLEEELEWAGRGPAGLSFPKGYARTQLDDPEQLKLRAVGSDPRDQSDSVSDRPLFDLWGNASEFALFDYRPYPDAIQTDLYLPRRHVARGGLWEDPRTQRGGNVRVIRLGLMLRGEANRGNVNPLLGFRCARSLRSWRGPDSSTQPPNLKAWGAP